jgi:glyoxylase-like metal-dependent hydrolase (beta-lactamase superfamily II)
MDDTLFATARVFALGAATITIVNAGDSLWRLDKMMDVPASARRSGDDAILTELTSFPNLCVHIALADASVLVDASAYDFPPDSPQRPPGYAPPADLDAQLAAAGVRADAITHLVITHLHGDHFNAATVERDGVWVPRFPHARCLIGRADWEQAETQAALAEPDSLEACTLGVLWRAGLVELVAGDCAIAPGVSLLAAPGESPGHQIVRVTSQGQTLYCVGDLYHHPIEVERPAVLCAWCDPAPTLASRQRVAAAALAEHALLVAAHIPTVGRLEAAGAGAVWVPADMPPTV